MNRKLVILLTIFIDVLGIGIIIPVLPFYVESFGASAITVTLLFAVYSLFSFFSAPLLGAWSDKIGRRPILLLSILSTSLGWLVFAAAPSIIWLFIGRIIDGSAAGNFPLAQSYLVDIARDDKEKTTNLGLIGAIFGVGLIIGPLLGGFLSSYSTSLPFWLVGGMAFVNFVLAYFNLPETHHDRDTEKRVSLNPLKPILVSFQNPSLRFGFAAWFFFTMALAVQQSTFSLYLFQQFGLGAIQVGLVMAGMGVILVFNQAFALKNIWLKKFAEYGLNARLSLILGVGFFLMGIPIFGLLIVGVALISLAQSVLRATITSRMAKRGQGRQHGLILGVMNSVMSLGMILGPIVAGWVFIWRINWPFWLSGFLALIASLLLFIDREAGPAEAGLTSEELDLEEQKMELA